MNALLNTLAGLIAGSILCVHAVRAEPPTLKGLQPVGLQRGTEATLKVLGTLKNRPVSVWSDQSDVTLKLAEDKDELTVSVPADAAPGRRWVRFYNNEGSSDLVPLQIGLLPELVEAEPNNRLTEATAVESLPVTINGVLHKSQEVDVFRVHLQAGETLVAAVEAHEPLGTPMDGVLQLVAENGFVLAQNDDAQGMDPLLTWTAAEAGDVYVRLFAFPATPDSSIRFAGGDEFVYRLTLTAGPFVSHVLTPTASNEGGQLAIIGWNVPDGPLDPFTTPGLQHARAERWLSGDMTHFTNSDSAVDAAPLLTRDASTTGLIGAAGTTQRWGFSAAKGEAVRLEVIAREIGSPLDPVLTITDRAGKRKKDADDVSRENLDVDLTWKAPADGEYVAMITDRFGAGSERHVYQLLLSREEPRVELTVDAGRFVLTRDKALDISIKVDRKAGHQAKLIFSVEGLPDGLTVAEAVSEPKGETAKLVKLKLEAGTAGEFNGPVRLVARDEAGDVAGNVTAGSPLEGVRVEDLWLTITPKAVPETDSGVP
ncbi:MAG: hypothetical protein KDA75_11020 [Planctomycetaceae bacterium]|nr:hypothetical protein [Planctomycetaceae bacterium]